MSYLRYSFQYPLSGYTPNLPQTYVEFPVANYGLKVTLRTLHINNTWTIYNTLWYWIFIRKTVTTPWTRNVRKYCRLQTPHLVQLNYDYVTVVHISIPDPRKHKLCSEVTLHYTANWTDFCVWTLYPFRIKLQPIKQCRVTTTLRDIHNLYLKETNVNCFWVPAFSN